MRKPHAKSKLKTLPPDRQEEIYLYLAGDGADQSAHTLEETEAWLATAGLDTNRSSLSEFYHWYPVAAKLRAASDTTEAVKAVLEELPGLDLREHQVSQAMQAVFEAEALKANDSKLYLALRSLRQTDRSLDLQEESGKTKARQKDKQLAQKDQELAIARERLAIYEDERRRVKETLTKAVADGGITPETRRLIDEAMGVISS